ncbi:hypothetical protein GCM10008107_11120 [Psychrosphaera saromensis]|uniref:hypothetical protein n=1 Tax=Psychrosphaera saromensis TaxID=716813 RepID=UPI000CF42256|nr:hypothetical protein [Psychrosphaera saromensis]GHB63788.1 hypothetical protein GCM10008107_11120 [Psychrosphaera saromensis]GLQ15615.1 hypothetical protein GCM10007917_30700 [Psychrosphaera saromensis]
MNSRLILSGVVSFVFYFGWAYWANSADNIPSSVTLQAALVQGLYSGFVTLFFTLILEKVVNKYKTSYLSLAFVTPILCLFHSKTPQNLAVKQSLNNAINRSAAYFKHKKLAGTLFAPIIPIAVQSVLVIGVNVANQTPNLALTVAPSILFTALYAYTYMFALLKR